MNPAPIPQPAAQTCPNCGAAVDGNVNLCPNCGATLNIQSNQLMGCFAILAQLVLVFVALAFSGLGACFILAGALDVSGDGFRVVIWGLLALLMAGACVWGIMRINKH